MTYTKKLPAANTLTVLNALESRQAWAEVVQQSQATGQPITAAREARPVASKLWKKFI